MLLLTRPLHCLSGRNLILVQSFSSQRTSPFFGGGSLQHRLTTTASLVLERKHGLSIHTSLSYPQRRIQACCPQRPPCGGSDPAHRHSGHPQRHESHHTSASGGPGKNP